MVRRNVAKRVAGTALTLVTALGICSLAVAPAQAEDHYKITLGMNECGVMAVGVTGTCIVSLQTWLNIFDNANLVVDGRFGPKTKRAVQHFQSEHGLKADGRVGPNTRNALRGEFQYMMDNSVATPRLEKNGPVTLDVGETEPGLHGGLFSRITCIGVAAGAGAVGGVVGTPITGFGSAVAADAVCQIILD
jgi:peptidoglycan hydrolase-like protein with peptidoglycan-binding domain